MKKLHYSLSIALALGFGMNLSAQNQAPIEPAATQVIQAPIQDPEDLDSPPPLGLLGGGEIKIEEASLYPNPGEGLLNIKLGGQHEGFIRVFDLNGRMILEEPLDPLSKKDPSIDLRPLPDGVYVVRVGNRSLKYRKI